MLRVRNPRITNKRNPNNLHVISTAGYLSTKLQTPNKSQLQTPGKQQNSQPQQQAAFNKPQPLQNPQLQEPKTIPSVVPAVSGVNARTFFNKSQIQNKYKGRYGKGRKKRNRKRDIKPFVPRFLLQTTNDQWTEYNPDFENQNKVIDSLKTETPNLETTAIETPNIETPNPETHNTEKVEATPTPVEENYFEEVEVASSEGEEKDVLVGFRKTKLHYLKYKKKCFFKPKMYKFSSQRTIVNCLNVEDRISVDGSVDVDIVSEAEYDEYEYDNLERSDSLEKIGNIIEIEEESNDADETEKEVSVHNSESLEISKRNFKTCIQNSDNFFQGKSFIQTRLESWNSHLIGLEYLIEIQDKCNEKAVKYHCVLCDEDLEEIKDFSDIYVVNHISGHKHVLKYLEKHFPACGYKFSKNSDYKFNVLQKLCEKINENLGYYSICTTDMGYYTENGMEIKEAIRNAFHPNENDFKLDISTFEKTVDSDLMGEIKNIINVIIEKAIPEKDNLAKNGSNKNITKAVESDAHVTKVKTDSIKIKDKDCNKDIEDALKAELAVKNVKTRSKEKTVGKHKGNNSISSYLRLSFAACGTLRKSDKGLSKKSQETLKKNIKSDDKKMMESKSKNEVPKETVMSKTEVIKETNKSKKEEVIDVLVDSGKSKNAQMGEQLMNKEAVSLKKFSDNYGAVQSNEVCDASLCDTSEKVQKTKEKVLSKSTLHSKHCRKRVLDKEISRLRPTPKASAKTRFVTGVSNKSSVKCKPITKSVGNDAIKKNISKKN